MGKEVRIVVVGLGSIGRRHLAHLQAVGNVVVAALRTHKGVRNEKSGVQEFFTLDEALAFKPHGVIIANPTSLHVSTALPFLQAGIKVLIEKPIASSTSQAKLLKPFATQLRVAYCLRFSELALRLSEIFKKDPPFKVSFKRSFYLPKWHPYADYRKEYTAKKELGGGVIRTLSHEIDLALHWFGGPKSVIGVTDRLSFLDIDTDDFAFFTMKTQSGARINFELDFFSPSNINEGEAFTANGKYYWNTNELLFHEYDSIQPVSLFSLTGTHWDTMYQNQMNDFINFIRSNGSINSTFDESIMVLNVIENLLVE